MRLLLDTHYLVWLTDDPTRLSDSEKAALELPSNRFWASAVSIWEIRLKYQKLDKQGLPKLGHHPDAALRTLAFMGVPIIDLDQTHAAAMLAVPLSHRDPFDEMLLIQAQEEGLLLMTRDGELADHPLTFIA